jgi:hypothetical protein
MTQEQRDLLQKELSDFKGRRVYNIKEVYLLQSNLKMTSLEKVKEYYEVYLKTKSLTETAKKVGLTNHNLLEKFHTYNFQLLGRPKFRNTIPITEKHRDTQIMSYTEWNTKYGLKGGNGYYKNRERMLKYLEEQGSVDS